MSLRSLTGAGTFFMGAQQVVFLSFRYVYIHCFRTRQGKLLLNLLQTLDVTQTNRLWHIVSSFLPSIMEYVAVPTHIALLATTFHISSSVSGGR